MEKAFKKLELVVDQFFNQTVEQADIVLPVTTLFEEWTVNVGYWHYWLSLNEQAVNPRPYVYINPETARARNIGEGDRVTVKNKTGEVTITASLTDNVPVDAILMYEAWFKNNNYNCQTLVDDTSADMGGYKAGAPGVAIHDQFADLVKA